MDRSDVTDYLRRRVGTVYGERRIKYDSSRPCYVTQFYQLKTA